MSKRTRLLLAIPALLLLGVVVYFLPPVHDRLGWRVEEQLLRLRYMVNPPSEVVFQPGEANPEALPEPAVRTRRATPESPSPDGVLESPYSALPVAPASSGPEGKSADATGDSGAAVTPPSGDGDSGADVTPPSGDGDSGADEKSADAIGDSKTPSGDGDSAPTPTPLPPQVLLQGVVYEDQHGRWNYCAPANLAMALSYWGWPGDRDVVGPLIKPNEKDKNVMPYELVDYVHAHTGVRALERSAGDLDLLRRLLAGGFPVLIEKGSYLRDLTGVVSWMGHYTVVTGYDDAAGEVVTQDSFIRENYRVAYDELLKNWRAFNYTYVLVYPFEREAELMALLGADAGEAANWQRAAEKAQAEISVEQGLPLYFAWYNRGTSLVKLEQYAAAAEAYDQAFKLYASLPQNDRPWRMLWYQTGPYFAYYHAGRYQDVIDLADATLRAMQSDKNLEETYHWRAMAHAALGDKDAARADFALALTAHPGFLPSVAQMQTLGVLP